MDQNIVLKLILIDIFPSIDEIMHNNNNEEISIIFQGLNIFYNLKDLLSNKKVIYINKQIPKNNELILSLIQSIQILATGILSVKSGKQWVTFSYQNKKKSTSLNLVQSLIDCIKINFSCEIIFNNIEYYYNTILSNNIKKSLRNNFSKKEIKINIIQNKYSKNTNKKKKDRNVNEKNKSNNSQEKCIINGYNFNGNNTYLSGREKNLSFKSNRENFIKNINSFSTINRDARKFDLNSSLSLSTNKYPNTEQNKYYSTLLQKFKNSNKTNYSLFEQSFNEFEVVPKIEVKEELNLLKKNKTINDLKLKETHKKQNSCNTLKVNESKSSLRCKKNNNHHIELNGIKNNDSSKRMTFNDNNNNKVNTSYSVQRKKSNNKYISININKNSNNFQFSIERNNLYNISSTSMNTKSYLKKSDLEISTNSLENNNQKLSNNVITENKSYKNIQDLNLNNIANNFLFNNNKKLNTYLSDKNLDVRNQTLENINKLSLDNNHFHRLKEDFILLYTSEYVRNIKEDLLKLEIELFVEKMIELTKEYHIQLNDKFLEYQIEKYICNQNLSNFIKINKLWSKLQLVKINYEAKRKKKSYDNKIFTKQSKDFFNTNQNEVNLYKILWNNNLNEAQNKIKLKSILNIILNKQYIRENNIINDNKILSKFTNFLTDNKTMDNQPIIRARIIPKNQQTKFNNNKLNLTNSYIWNNSNGRPDIYIEKNPYFKTHIFSPSIRIKNIKPNIIDKIKNVFITNS